MTATSAGAGTAVALNGDIVGYSRLIADDLEATTLLLAEYRQVIEAELGSRSGTLANFVGDSFMAMFDRAEDAVGAAIAVTTELERRNADLPAHRRVTFRMGVDEGPVGVTDGGYHGDALNIAARIQAIAPEGGLSISGRVYQALDEPALRFRATGRQRLKNIPEDVEVYEFADLPTVGAVRRDTSLSLEAPTVAVLPIHTEGATEEAAAAAGVIRMELLHRLARVPQLKVVDTGLEPATDRVPASARYMLETGIHQVGDHVRVYATLFDVGTMNIVGSHKWRTTVAGMLDLDEEVADEVAREMEVDLIVGEPAGLYADLDDPAAIEQVYMGWYHLRTDTREGWARALELFEGVARSHPEQPYGSGLMAFALYIGAANGWAADQQAMLEDARSRAAAAAALGDPTGMAQAVEAAVLMSSGEVDQALETLENLEIIRPTCDVTYGLAGSIRRYLGEWERAVELLDTAMRLTGINKPWYPTVKACSLFLGGRLEDAAALAEGVLEYQPENLEALLVLAAAQSELGMERRARATVDLIARRFPAVDVEAWLEANPYQQREIVDRWRDDLESAGLTAE